MSTLFVLLPIRPGVYQRFNQKEFLYIKADGCYSIIKHKTDSYLLVSISLKNLTSLLHPKIFLRISRAYLINVLEIKKISQNNIILEDNISISIVKGKKREIINNIYSLYKSHNK